MKAGDRFVVGVDDGVYPLQVFPADSNYHGLPTTRVGVYAGTSPEGRSAVLLSGAYPEVPAVMVIEAITKVGGYTTYDPVASRARWIFKLVEGDED